jgi:hypothetical protein
VQVTRSKAKLEAPFTANAQAFQLVISFVVGLPQRLAENCGFSGLGAEQKEGGGLKHGSVELAPFGNRMNFDQLGRGREP